MGCVLSKRRSHGPGRVQMKRVQATNKDAFRDPGSDVRHARYLARLGRFRMKRICRLLSTTIASNQDRLCSRKPVLQSQPAGPQLDMHICRCLREKKKKRRGQSGRLYGVKPPRSNHGWAPAARLQAARCWTRATCAHTSAWGCKAVL